MILATLLVMGIYSPLSFAYEREIENISSLMLNSIAKSGKKAIAVVDFTDLQGNVNELGRFLAEELSGTMANAAQGMDIIDRNHLKSIMAEHKLSMSGLLDPNTVKKVGQISGAEVLVTGTITPFGDSIRVACKAIDTGTARVIGSAKSDIAKTVTMAELLTMAVSQDSKTKGRQQTQTAQAGWTGTWMTDYGRMYLAQQGNRVTGTYDYMGGRIEGTVAGSVLSGTWVQTNNSGRLEFRLSADGRTYDGVWGYGQGISNGLWRGTRQ